MAAPHPPTVQDLMSALEPLTDPLTGASWVADKAIRNVQVQGDVVSLELELGYPAQSRHEALRQILRQAALAVPGVAGVEVQISTRVVAHAVQGGVQLLPQVRNIVAVASGKGGVCKSTTAANLALALVAEGARVGLLDADIYGPSQPMMMGISGRPETEDGKTMEPLINHGV